MFNNFRSRARFGFTVVELLVVLATIGVLASLLLSALRGVRTRGACTREVSAARQLMIAYLDYAGDHDGELLPGYGPFPAKDELGQTLGNPENQRYPWRLAPYLGYDLRILWGNNDDDQLRKLAAGPRDAYVYGVSVQPSLGLNVYLVGGDYASMAPDEPLLTARYGNFCLTRLGQAFNPSQTIVFASAASGGGSGNGGRLAGYFRIEPPYLKSRIWPSSWDSSVSANKTGYVDFRYDGRAVAAMLDGHVETLNFAEMTDMQRWSSQAAEARNPAYTLRQPAP